MKYTEEEKAYIAKAYIAKANEPGYDPSEDVELMADIYEMCDELGIDSNEICNMHPTDQLLFLLEKIGYKIDLVE